MRHVSLWIVGLAPISGCGRLDSIPYQPQQTAETQLTMQPFVHIRLGSEDIVLVQPSSTAPVYLVGT
jgi:hypothetical protein